MFAQLDFSSTEKKIKINACLESCEGNLRRGCSCVKSTKFVDEHFEMKRLLEKLPGAYTLRA